MSRTPSETDPDGVPGEHMHLIALLNTVWIQSNIQTRGAENCEAVVRSWVDRIIPCNGVRRRLAL